jgi:hypothetical protein
MPEDMPDRMPEDMPDKTPEDMSDRMPEDLPVTRRIDVMVGITRSKVINFFDYILQRYNCPMFSLQIYQETIRKLLSFSISQGFVRFRSIAQSKSRCDSRAHDAPSPWCGSS